MAKGGYRPGAGRPRGSTAKSGEPNRVRVDIEAKKAGLNPLDYMIGVMNDDAADDARRDRMAIAAAPFVHSKPGDMPLGKKGQAEEESKTAGRGTDWGDDLGAPSSALN